MANLTVKRPLRLKEFETVDLPATAGTYFQGGVVGWDTSTGLITKAGASTTFLAIGWVADSQLGSTIGAVTVASGGTLTVHLFRLVRAIWMVNATAGDAVVAANLGNFAYCVDDQTVANNDATNTRPVMGRIWALDTVRGVLVEPRNTAGDARLTEIDS